MIVHVATANFFFSTWEEFHTGTLYLGIISGPVEGIVMLVLTFFFAGLFGVSFFEQPWTRFTSGTVLSRIPYLQQYTLGEVIALSSSGLMLLCILMA